MVYGVDRATGNYKLAIQLAEYNPLTRSAVAGTEKQPGFISAQSEAGQFFTGMRDGTGRAMINPKGPRDACLQLPTKDQTAQNDPETLAHSC